MINLNQMTLEQIEQYVLENSKTGDPNSSLMDWLSGSDFDGLTLSDVISEWDEDQDYIQNCTKL